MTEVRRSPPATFTIFGASGDLTARKLLPALGALADDGLLGDGFGLVGVARTKMSDDEFRAKVDEATPEHGEAWRAIVGRARYVAGGYDDDQTYATLARVVKDFAHDTHVAYLAAVPAVVPGIIRSLGTSGIATRVVIEKPFGQDLASARALDELCHRYFDERQIYRIDHYLGKETVQNVLALRFANAIFEPIWNRRYVDHVQITVAEQLGVEGRAGFYESAGALRDVVQNHVMQVFALIAMEPPGQIDAEGIRDEKVKVLKAVESLDAGKIVDDVVRGQYTAGTIDGEAAPGYREEERVAPDSDTETFVALRLGVDNWRWAGVPFYLRTGKRLPKRATEVALRFQTVPHLPFAATAARGLHANTLIVRVQPDEGIMVEFGAKVPGQGFTLRSVSMDFCYDRAFAEKPHDGYERLLLDALVGDPTLFIRSDETQAAWAICDPILAAWREGIEPVVPYAAGTWGPREADRLLERDGRWWRQP